MIVVGFKKLARTSVSKLPPKLPPPPPPQTHAIDIYCTCATVPQTVECACTFACVLMANMSWPNNYNTCISLFIFYFIDMKRHAHLYTSQVSDYRHHV